MSDFLKDYAPYILMFITYLMGRFKDLSTTIENLRKDINAAHKKIRQLQGGKDNGRQSSMEEQDPMD
jgi:hypothetical protein